jgi:polar amino acid transport system permease protein
MSKRQAILRIVLPQALIRMLPAIATQVVTTIKDSALASVLAVPELLTQSQTLSAQTYKPFPIFTADMVIFFLIAFPVGRAIDRVYRRVAPLGSS